MSHSKWEEKYFILISCLSPFLVSPPLLRIWSLLFSDCRGKVAFLDHRCPQNPWIQEPLWGQDCPEQQKFKAWMLACIVHKFNRFHLAENYVENWLLYRSIRRRELVGSGSRAPMNIFIPLWVVPSSNGDWVGYRKRRKVYHNIRLTFMPFQMISCFLFFCYGLMQQKVPSSGDHLILNFSAATTVS